jgi:PAS domain S-box-containing protein
MSVQPPTLLRTERALADSEIRLQQVVDNSSAIFFAKDRHGRYLFVNREFERVTGRNAADLLGRSDDEIFRPELATLFRKNDLRVLQEGRSLEFEETADFGEGLRTFISAKFPLLDSDGVAYAVCGTATDITERKRREEAFSVAALAVSQSEDETLYRQLARYMCAILGVEGAFIATVSPERPGELRMLAFHLDGAVQENFSYPMTGTPCETVVGQCYRLYGGRLTQLFPQDEDFKRMGLESYAGHPLRSADGRPLGLIAAISRRPFADPTLVEATLRIFAVRVTAELERGQAEQALRSSEEQYRAIFNASADAMVLWNSQCRRVDVNPAFERLYGWTREEVIGQGFDFPRFSPEHETSRAELVRRALAGETCHVEHEVVARHGQRFQAEVHAIPFQRGGEPHVLVIARDITGRKRAEEALRASEEQYRTIFNAAVDALVLEDENHQIVDVNDAYLRMHGFPRERMLGRNAAEFIPAELQEPCSRLLPEIVAGKPCRFEAQTRRADGGLLDVEIHGVPMTYRGRPHALVMLRDLTESKRAAAAHAELEGRLRQAQKMEAIGQLTGGIAHDFNNLLTSIMGYVALAADRESALGDRRLAGYLAQVRRSCERARDLIQQMLMFSRARRGSPRSASLADIVNGSLPTLAAGLPDGLELAVSIDESAPPVYVDPAQVEQVLLNLCINARDATDGVGRLQISIRPGHVHDAPCTGCRDFANGPFVELVVEDDGHGMSPDIVERIFEPFFSTKETGKGSGMGLAMVHGIVHEHGGHVLVESTPGEGSRFRVLWPLATEAGDGASRSTEPTAPDRLPRPTLSGKVLVVDDEESVGEFMRELLDTWGVEATCVSYPDVALDLFRAAPERFDVVITDQSMPRMTGLELARRLRELRPELPVILYTGHGDGLPDDEVSAARLCALVRKPVDPAVLGQALGRCLATRPPAG